MPVLCGTKVIAESLVEFYDRLAKEVGGESKSGLDL
jgi:hypothetical protein